MINVSKLKVGDEVFGRGIANVKNALRQKGLSLKQKPGSKVLSTKTGKVNKIYVVYKLRR